jgi:hypothetical protein
VVGIQPTNLQARAVMPQLPILDHLYDDATAGALQRWRSQRCNPSSAAHEASPLPPMCPMARKVEVPEQYAVLEVTVHPDACTEIVRATREEIRPGMAIPVRP